MDTLVVADVGQYLLFLDTEPITLSSEPKNNGTGSTHDVKSRIVFMKPSEGRKMDSIQEAP